MDRRTMLFGTAAAGLLPLALGSDLLAQEANKGATADTVYELRTYHIAPGMEEALHKRFHEHTIALFERHGIHPVGFWSPIDGETPLLIYILRYKDLQASKEAWQAFATDPDWAVAKKASEVNGPLTTKIDSVHMKAVDLFPKA